MMDEHIGFKEINGVYDIPVRSIHGEENMLEHFRDKVTLFLPVATKCGYEAATDQQMSMERTHKKFQDLQVLHEEFEEKGFSVVAIPTNQLGEQEPCEDEEIAAFIESEYPYVTFAFTQKMNINPTGMGDSLVAEHPLCLYMKGYEIRAFNDYGPLSQDPETGEWVAGKPHHFEGGAAQEVSGLYEKFVFDRDGLIETRFNFAQEPLMDKSIHRGGRWTVREAVDFILSQPRRPKHVGHEWHYSTIGPVPNSIMPTERPFSWQDLFKQGMDRYSDESPPPSDLLAQHAIDVVYACINHLGNNDERKELVVNVIQRLETLVDAGKCDIE
jgi:glutathione peroxidase